ncbi:MAG: hypothetical protein HY763_02215 [Planctomycetes bacterium]|nr:hypothetical protein [Planctomycetota bacterium]
MSDMWQDKAVDTVPFAAPEVGAGLKTVRLAPWGEVVSVKGKFLVDEQAAASIVEAFKRHGVALPIDQEHDTLPEYAPPAGARGAVGWIEEVYAEPGKGLFGLVKWSDRGRDLVRSEAYRYLSPVLVIRKSDGRAVELHSAALTTKPAIPKMEKLAASANAAGEVTATGAAVGRAEVTLSNDAKVAALTRSTLGLPGDADLATVAQALSRRTASDAEVTARRSAEAFVDDLVRGNKLNPHGAGFAESREAWVTLAMTDRATAEKLGASLTPLVEPGRTRAPDRAVVDRMRFIGEARREWAGNRTTRGLTSEKAYVANALREAGLAPLKSEETADLVAV